jgi:hypothetical protein
MVRNRRVCIRFLVIIRWKDSSQEKLLQKKGQKNVRAMRIDENGVQDLIKILLN